MCVLGASSVLRESTTIMIDKAITVAVVPVNACREDQQDSRCTEYNFLYLTPPGSEMGGLIQTRAGPPPTDETMMNRWQRMALSAQSVRTCKVDCDDGFDCLKGRRLVTQKHSTYLINRCPRVFLPIYLYFGPPRILFPIYLYVGHYYTL